MRYKEDFEEFKKIVDKFNITKLYHFTDEKNLPSIIKNGGLYSWWYCECNGIVIPAPGGNDLSRDLDSRDNLENHVRLNFNNSPPMLHILKAKGRIVNPLILEIDPSVIYWETTKFSNENATHNGAFVGSNLSDFNKIDLNLAKQKYKSYEHTDMQKRLNQAEVMVEEHIPIKFIKNI